MNVTPLRVEEFTMKDYRRVRELWKRCGLVPSPGDDQVQVRRKLRRDPQLFLVARKSGKIVGAVMGAWDGRRGWIYHLAVAPSARRTGVASRLLQEVERRMVKMGVVKVNAIIYRWNDPSLRLFDKHGFSRQDTQVVVGKLLKTTSQQIPYLLPESRRRFG